MTEKINSAIRTFNQLLFLGKVDLPKEEIENNIETAIRSLNAWSEVLNELNETKEHATDLVRPKILGREIKELTDMCFDEAIDIIKQKLSEVEECTKAL